MIRRSLLAALFLLVIASPAWALNCSSNPFTLVDGQTALATQVMANFNNLLTCANTVLGKFTGPAVAVSGNAVTFNGTTGQLGQDSGVALNNSQWTAYSPGTITCQTGGPNPTASSTSGRFKTIGKSVLFIISFTITTNGTCGGLVNLGLPAVIGPLAAVVASGNRPASLGNTLTCIGSAGFSTMGCVKYDGTYPFTDGTSWIVSGSYESS